MTEPALAFAAVVFGQAFTYVAALVAASFMAAVFFSIVINALTGETTE